MLGVVVFHETLTMYDIFGIILCELSLVIKLYFSELIENNIPNIITISIIITLNIINKYIYL